MIRFFSILLLNAWRGMRRANATPALILTLVAVCVLFVGSNASARSSIQRAAHIVGLPVALPAQPSNQTNSGNIATKPTDTHSSEKGNARHDESQHQAGSSSGQTTNGTQSAANQSSHSNVNATLSLNPNQITPTCDQGQSDQVYAVQSAQLTLGQPFNADTKISWFWESRIDSGTNPSLPPVSPAQHSQTISAGSPGVLITANDPSQPLLSALANGKYAYSFRMDIVSPFTANSPWVSVPQDTGVC